MDFNKVCEIIRNINLSDISNIAVDKDGYIIDGHHRWTAYMYINPTMEIPIYQFNIKLKNLISRKVAWYSFDNKLDNLIKTVFTDDTQP